MQWNSLRIGIAILCLSVTAVAQEIDPRIVNGVSSFNWPTTVSLNTASGGFPFCSGTLVGCQTVVTAAHCVCDTDGTQCQPGGPDLDNPADIAVHMQHGKAVAVTEIHVPSTYVFGSAADVAVLKLAEPVTSITPSKINDSLFVPFNTPGSIVGYGRSRQDVADAGVKREGKIVSSACDAPTPNSEHICWDYTTPPGPPGEDSNTCSGDSGGPLYMLVNNEMVLAGVTSGGGTTCHLNDNAFDADVYANRVFIQDKAGVDLNAQSCGALPAVGQAGAQVIAHGGLFTAPDQQVFMQVDVPADTDELRVVLNGETASSNDMDLYVREGIAPNEASYDCRPFISGNFESCIFSNPAAGPWYIMVDLFSGSAGEYQVTSTLFNSSVCMPSFTDVPCDYWAFDAIEQLLAAGITAGCGLNTYCPFDNVTRAQMAIFMLRSINGGSYVPPVGSGTIFDDVPPGAFALDWIEQFFALGITSGCGVRLYCPESNITRAQMAVFLLRSKYGSGYTPPAASGTLFNDVGAGSFAADWIEQLAAEGITLGCDTDLYCPEAPVTRTQMAVFIGRTFTEE